MQTHINLGCLVWVSKGSLFQACSNSSGYFGLGFEQATNFTLSFQEELLNAYSDWDEFNATDLPLSFRKILPPSVYKA